VVEEIDVARTALGAACAMFDATGRVLLVHHTYGRLNWELPGGLVESGEAPHEGAIRELLEETGLPGELDRLTGVYFEAEHEFGQMLHCVFRVAFDERHKPAPSSPEISEVGFWPLDELPRPISDFTERRIRDALSGAPVAVVRIGARRWRE
jgi:ADP-ribose pyrophosphatase YjhB (NUDIX family)